MTIPTIDYRGHELRAYSQCLFPPFGDPHSPGPRRFGSIVRIDTIPPTSAPAVRYRTIFANGEPSTEERALDDAMQFGKDIVDGKITPVPI
ncbi:MULTISPECIES: hypothetical protein [Burkholderia]|nr:MULTISPECIES: hypothetical protein [Burkholderia]MBU9278497.1 hypothetical protein [Burkholderia gladioli]MCA8171562.1 hypothetical protein [Burkholderia gladioli]MDN7466361.1 hypothetical protein [Burkholderia gladioli]MDN7741665.1 hypothetical protein [Burkholderia gladioli]MDN7814537.1 hypothetical protein [Burkholderia gladioli]